MRYPALFASLLLTLFATNYAMSMVFFYENMSEPVSLFLSIVYGIALVWVLHIFLGLVMKGEKKNDTKQ